MATIKHRVHRMNSSGSYDTIHYETEASCVIVSDGNTAEQHIQSLWAEKAASSHNHAASNITSGTLGLARGGTNATSGAAAIYQITNPASALASTGLASGDYLPVLDTSAGTGKKVTIANLTAYLKATGNGSLLESDTYNPYWNNSVTTYTKTIPNGCKVISRHAFDWEHSGQYDMYLFYIFIPINLIFFCNVYTKNTTCSYNVVGSTSAIDVSTICDSSAMYGSAHLFHNMPYQSYNNTGLSFNISGNVFTVNNVGCQSYPAWDSYFKYWAL